MTGITIDIEIPAAEIRERLGRIIDRLDQPLSLYRDIGQHMIDSTRENFRKESSPEGVPWAKLRPSTLRGRKRQKLSLEGILRARGTLINSINVRATAEGVTIGSPAEYAAIHQLGGEIERQARSQTIYRKQRKDGSFEPKFRKRKLKTSVQREVAVGAHSIRIPARPYIGVSSDDQVAIAEIARKWILGE